MWKEFKAFIMRGNVLDLAIGLIVGAAFGKIVTSLVTDIIMPPIGLLLKRVNFNELYINLSGQHYNTLDEAKKAGAVTINYGTFINNILDFVIVAFVVFLVIRQANKLHLRAEETPTTKNCPFCFSTISINATRCPNCTSELKDGKAA